MERKEILAASQFMNAVKEEQGVELALSDIHLGRLEFPHNEDMAKDNGYVCFYAQKGNQLYYLKAFKGKTVREVKKVPIGDVKVKCEFILGHTFVTAYQGTTWRYYEDNNDCRLITEKAYQQAKKK